MTVAPTGNRLRNDTGDTGSALVPEEQFGEFRPGENARDVVHPAAYDDVLAVNASMAGTGGADPHLYVLENSATDLAAPTAGGVSLHASTAAPASSARPRRRGRRPR